MKQQELLSSGSARNSWAGEDPGPGVSPPVSAEKDTTHAPPSSRCPVHPLMLEGWLQFNSEKHQVDVLKIQSGSPSEDGPYLCAAVYLDRRGRVIRPWRNPYLPVTFLGTPTPYAHRVERQWLESAELIVKEMQERGVANEIHLPPSIQDVRPWQWAGYNIGVRYTYTIDFPFDRSGMSKQMRARLRRSERDGYRCERTTDLAAVHECLRAAESRQGYSLGVTLEDLRKAHGLLGDEHLHAYIAYASNGEPASAALALHTEGSRAMGWLGGTVTEHLSGGAADLVEVESYEGLRQAGALGIDLCGANMPSIAAYKASLGAKLVPYYSIEAYDSRRLAKWMRSWWGYQQKKREG